jgi:chromate transporter
MAESSRPSFGEALRFWHKLGWISFGGPAGQIAIMQSELVDRRGWIGQGAFLNALNFCMLLPGPEAQQLATYVGWRLHGWRGAVTAGGLFVLPGALVMFLLSWLLAAQGGAPPVAAVLAGIKPVVIGIVFHALWRIGKRALKGWAPVALAALAFLALYVLNLPFPLVVLAAGVIGALSARLPHTPFAAPSHGPAHAGDAPPLPDRWLSRAAFYLVLFAVLWALPVVGLILWLGPDPFGAIARLFTTAAFVTFGGAYAVLPYIADVAVNDYGWLTATEMVDGLALAETTPGPLIMVLQYVGFLAGWRQAGVHAPLLAGGMAAALTTYVTFLPSFLFILLGAPYLEALTRIRWAGAALGAITAAVVGVILNLAVFLGGAVLFPQMQPDWPAIAAAILTLVLLWRWQPGIHWLVAAGAAFGLARAALDGML